MRSIMLAATGLLLAGTLPTVAKVQYGPGAVSCRAFLDSVGKDPATDQRLRDWVAGFLSGFNETLPGPDGLKEGQEDQYFQAVQNKCKAIPDQPLSDAVSDLEIELRTKLGD